MNCKDFVQILWILSQSLQVWSTQGWQVLMNLMVRLSHGSVIDCRLHTIQIFFTMVGVAMGFFSVMLLVFGFLATGATRQNIYSGTKCIMGGRVSAAFVSFVPNFRAFCSTL